MKYLKLYVTPEDVVEKLKDKTDKTNVVFTNVEIGVDGCISIECLVTEDQLENTINNVRRQRIFETNKYNM